MSTPMIDMDRVRELVRLHRLRCSTREIARLLRMGPNTQRRYCAALARAGLIDGPVANLPDHEALRAAVLAELPPLVLPQQQSSLAGWRPRVEALLDRGLTPRAIFDRLRLDGADDGTPFTGSYSAVKRLCRRVARDRGPVADDVVITVEARPGESAQVDFGYVGKLYDPERGVLRRTWIFVLVLSFSRLMFVRLVFDQSIETWLRLHVEAFAELGGVVETVVPDRLTRAVTRAAFGVGGAGELNRSYRELARHYGFKIDPCPPRAPRKKGKVEAAVKYALGNGLAARTGTAFDEAQAALARWNREIASTRVHGTTKRRPIDMFERDERPALRPLPRTPYELAVWKRARVHPDSHVCFRGRLYSVPWRLIDREVWVRGTPTTVTIFNDDELVATHDARGPRRSTIDGHLPEGRRDLRHRGREFWERRAAQIGSETLVLVRAVFDSDDVLSQLRSVQAIVRLLERHPRERAEAASRRALRLGDLSYRGMKRTLAYALDRAEAFPERSTEQDFGRRPSEP